MRETPSTRLARLLSPGALFVLLLFGVSPWPAAGQGSFTVDDLGVLPGDSSSVASGINQRGDVVGWSTGPDGTTHAFIYTDSGMVALPGLTGTSTTWARS
jgi:probable HAF family extracellular repeat protein